MWGKVGPLPWPSPLLNMLKSHDIRAANQMIEKLRRNPPKVTREHWDQAGKLLEKDKALKAEKDRDISREIKDFSKDLSGFVHNHVNGVGAVFHGIGEGKAKNITCSFPGCGKHESTMYNAKDGKWYDSEHRWFGNLNEEQKQKELDNVDKQNRQKSNCNL